MMIFTTTTQFLPALGDKIWNAWHITIMTSAVKYSFLEALSSRTISNEASSISRGCPPDIDFK
jgi:hypothetical protein